MSARCDIIVGLQRLGASPIDVVVTDAEAALVVAGRRGSTIAADGWNTCTTFVSPAAAVGFLLEGIGHGGQPTTWPT